MHTQIAQILKVEKKSDFFVTTIRFVDGGEVYEATGIGHDYREGEPIIAYLDDRYGRFKFHRPA